IGGHGAGDAGRKAGGRMSEQALDLKRSVRIVRRHWVIVLIAALLGLTGGAAYAVLQPPNLVSTALVRITSANSSNHSVTLYHLRPPGRRARQRSGADLGPAAHHAADLEDRSGHGCRGEKPGYRDPPDQRARADGRPGRGHRKRGGERLP